MTVDMKEVAPLAVEHKKAVADMKADVLMATALQMTVVVHQPAVVKRYGYSR